MISTKQVAKKIIDLLNDRAGFDDWWAGIDEDIKEEILQELEEVIEEPVDKKQ